MTSKLQRATQLHNQGLLAEAEALYRAVIAGEPRQPDALALLGLVVAARKDYAQACDLLEQAIACDPATPLFRYHLGTVLIEAGNLDAAAQAFDAALARAPSFAEAFYRMGLVRDQQKRQAEALACFRQAVQAKPDYAEAWVELSDAARRAGFYDEAYAAATSALRAAPHNLAAFIAQALALDFMDREEEELSVLKAAIEHHPGFLPLWDMLGTTYQNLGRLDEAQAVMRQAVARAANGVAFDEDDLGVDETAYSVQHWNLALLELLRGDFARGFAHYRARFKKAGRAQRLPFPQPLWRGEALSGKKILVVGEQGFGDVIMMARFLPLLRQQGAVVVLLAHEAIAPLLRQSSLADAVMTEAPATQGDFDYQTSLFDLPYHLHTTLDTLPAAPYLPEPLAVEALPQGCGIQIGVVWAGRRDFGNDRRRSLPLSVFVELFAETGGTFYNLTREIDDASRTLLARYQVIDLSHRLSDFTATARFVAQLDLVVTCDTAVAHLAGAMGKKVWILLPFSPDWRWLTERTDSPWYPKARLFRQTKSGDWGSVISRVRTALRDEIAARGQRVE